MKGDCIQIGRRLVVDLGGNFTPADTETIPIRIIPGKAFGDGKHPTTQLCLKALERHLQQGQTILDLGTGSGILSIAAAKLGAGKIFALDCLPEAVKATKENSAINQTENQIMITEGTLETILGKDMGQTHYGIVIANISLSVIIPFFEKGLTRLLGTGSLLILSGFLKSQMPAIRARLYWHNLKLLAQEKSEDWVCVIAAKE